MKKKRGGGGGEGRGQAKSKGLTGRSKTVNVFKAFLH